MKSIFLFSKQQLTLNLQKINSCLYYDTKNDTFYRLNVMPECTVFASEDVEQRQMLTLTRYDPAFHMIQMLYDSKAVNSADLPQFLKNKNWNLLASESTSQGTTLYSLNRNKVYNFLEKKAQALDKYLETHNPLERLKLIKLQPKQISQDAIAFLKNQISPSLVADFVNERYGYQSNRKIAPVQPIEVEAIKPKIQNKNKKPESKKQQSIPKNQATLFSSWGKK